MGLKLNTKKAKLIIIGTTRKPRIISEDIVMIDNFCFWESTILKPSLKDLKDR